MSARGGSARRGKRCPNGVKSKHLLLILWVFGMLLLLVCRVTVAEFVSAPLVAWSLGTISTHPRCCAVPCYMTRPSCPLRAACSLRSISTPCHFPGEWDPASFRFLSIEPSSALCVATVKSINQWIRTSCRAIMNWAEIEVLAGPRLPMFLYNDSWAKMNGHLQRIIRPTKLWPCPQTHELLLVEMSPCGRLELNFESS